MPSDRETFATSWGTVFATAGVAIGLGNIWRFPYMMGKFGGGAFLLIYLGVVVGFGIPALMCEWALGRATRRGPLGAFERAGLPGGKGWGYLLLLTITMASSYYVVILGWVLYYVWASLHPSLSQLPPERWLPALKESPFTEYTFVMACVLLGCLSLYFGVKKGIETVSKAITPLFFFLFLLLILRILTLEGAWQGLIQAVSPSWEQWNASTLLAALGQGLFSLSLGGTFMLIYGSYMREQENIPRAALLTAGMDVSAALLASLIILPAVFVFQLNLASGPPLMFEVMPQIFHSLPWGSLTSFAFFFSVFLVAMLSLIGAYEVLVGACQDTWGLGRGPVLLAILLSQALLVVFPIRSLDYILYSDLIWGSTMQPFGAALSVLALVWCMGRARAIQEITRNSHFPIHPWLFWWIKYVIPIGIGLALLYGWWGFIGEG